MATIQNPTYAASTTPPIGASAGTKVGFATGGKFEMENGLTVSSGRDTRTSAGTSTAVVTAVVTITRSYGRSGRPTGNRAKKPTPARDAPISVTRYAASSSHSVVPPVT